MPPFNGIWQLMATFLMHVIEYCVFLGKSSVVSASGFQPHFTKNKLLSYQNREVEVFLQVSRVWTKKESYLNQTRLILMRSNPDYVVVVVNVVVVVLIVVAVHKGLVVVDKSLSDTHWSYYCCCPCL